ncbi:hypothetical protein PMAYCL1PPCAC_06965, partial [Pristionchus mayeri]
SFSSSQCTPSCTNGCFNGILRINRRCRIIIYNFSMQCDWDSSFSRSPLSHCSFHGHFSLLSSSFLSHSPSRRSPLLLFVHGIMSEFVFPLVSPRTDSY